MKVEYLKYKNREWDKDALIKHRLQNDAIMVVFMAKIWPPMAK